MGERGSNRGGPRPSTPMSLKSCETPMFARRLLEGGYEGRGARFACGAGGGPLGGAAAGGMVASRSARKERNGARAASSGGGMS